jgi:osmotically inducible protein OsmC
VVDRSLEDGARERVLTATYAAPLPYNFRSKPNATCFAKSRSASQTQVITLHLHNGKFSYQDTMTMSLEKVVYTGKAHTTGGRNGASRSSDGRLDIKLSSPGTPGNGTNPEQLFAAGWSACFMGAMGLAAAKMRTRLPADAAVDAEVDLCDNGGEYFLKARLNVSLPGIGREVAQAWVDAAHLTCPYSKATRGNVDVAISVA